jgi:hypothetical protein
MFKGQMTIVRTLKNKLNKLLLMGKLKLITVVISLNFTVEWSASNHFQSYWEAVISIGKHHDSVALNELFDVFLDGVLQVRSCSYVE